MDLTLNDFKESVCYGKMHGIVLYEGWLFCDKWNEHGFMVGIQDYGEHSLNKRFNVVVAYADGRTFNAESGKHGDEVELMRVGTLDEAVAQANYVVGTQIADTVDVYTCRACGWHGTENEILLRGFHEDFGDVDYAVCPSCGRVDVDGSLFEHE